VLSNGQVVGLDGSSLLNFTATINNGLYVVVWHRNHLGVLSASALTLSGGTYTYDFSSGAGQAYGGSTAQNLLGAGIWGMISGDGNGDGNITLDDINNVWKLQAGLSGYMAGDYNTDAEIENKDKNDHAIKNMNKSSQIPE